jgi:hypothetical protein
MSQLEWDGQGHVEFLERVGRRLEGARPAERSKPFGGGVFADDRPDRRLGRKSSPVDHCCDHSEPSVYFSEST